MSADIFNKIAEGLREARAIARNEKEPARLFIPAEIDVKRVRKKIGMTQDMFASSFGFTIDQIRNWEQGRSRPLQSNRAFLMFIDQSPDIVLQAINGYEKQTSSPPRQAPKRKLG